jgi:hypothetical protein
MKSGSQVMYHRYNMLITVRFQIEIMSSDSHVKFDSSATAKRDELEPHYDDIPLSVPHLV